MIILPAIDILDGKPVRLVQGDYNQVSQVADSVLDTAKQFEQQGAPFVHLVDLDGAKAGCPVNRERILETARALSIPVEVGGGIRTKEQAAGYLDNGVERVILSTAALQQPELVRELAAQYPGRIAAGLDCLNGQVKVAGWLEDGGVTIEQAVALMKELGVDTLIVTDISRDGMLSGASCDLYRQLSAITDAKLIASGGIASIDDIRALAKLDLYGAITGKAIYSGRLDLEEAIALAGEKTC